MFAFQRLDTGLRLGGQLRQVKRHDLALFLKGQAFDHLAFLCRMKLLDHRRLDLFAECERQGQGAFHLGGQQGPGLLGLADLLDQGLQPFDLGAAHAAQPQTAGLEFREVLPLGDQALRELAPQAVDQFNALLQ